MLSRTRQTVTRASVATTLLLGATIALMPQFDNSAQAAIEDIPLRDSFELGGNYLPDPKQARIDHENFIIMLTDPFVPLPSDGTMSEFPPKGAYKEMLDLPLTSPALIL